MFVITRKWMKKYTRNKILRAKQIKLEVKMKAKILGIMIVQMNQKILQEIFQTLLSIKRPLTLKNKIYKLIKTQIKNNLIIIII